MALALHHVFEILQFAALKPSTAREVRDIATHAYKSSLRQFTLFSGLVSRAALAHIEDGTYKGHTIVREHHRQMQRSLTAYIQERMDGAPWNYAEFEERVKHLSEVHMFCVNGRIAPHPIASPCAFFANTHNALSLFIVSTVKLVLPLSPVIAASQLTAFRLSDGNLKKMDLISLLSSWLYPAKGV